MKRFLLAILLVTELFSESIGNPLTPADFVYISSYPPKIGIVFRDSLNLAGDTIYTTSSSAVIYSHPIPGWDDTLFFDSCNTSGFTINPEAESIRISSMWYLNYIRTGTFWWPPAPIKGHPIHLVWVNPFRNEGGWYDWTYDFTFTDWGWTDVVINEINVHCNWRLESNFIELYNQIDSAINIGGWSVICDTVYTIPQNTVIEGNGFYTVDEIDFPDMFDFDFDADNIYLVKNDTIVDQVGWSSDHGENVSFMRFPDGDVDNSNYRQGYMGYDDASSYTFENGFPSRCAPNRHTSPGFVVIGAHGENVSGNVDLCWTDPVWDPNFAYSLAVRNFDHYPQDLNDGELIYQGTDQNVLDMVPPGNPLAYYTIFARNAGGGYSIPTNESRTIVILQTVGIDENPELPENISSLECYPNPFNASVTISFKLNQSGTVAISIYNLRGQKASTVIDGLFSVGEHRITWNGSDYPSGVYFARLEAGGSSRSIKMVLLK